MFSVDPWKDLWGDALNTSQPFVLSMGDTTGYGLHGKRLAVGCRVRCAQSSRLPTRRGLSHGLGRGYVSTPCVRRVCAEADHTSDPSLQQAVDECTDDSGVIEKCPVFDLYSYDDLADYRCRATPFIDEQVDGGLLRRLSRMPSSSSFSLLIYCRHPRQAPW